jgi:hypothetical protein
LPTLAELQETLARSILGTAPPLTGRLAVYRRLVRANLDEAVASILPRTLARLGDPLFWREVHLFYAEQGPQTHYLRDVPREFVAWCGPRWPDLPEIAPYLLDLARLEVALIQVGTALDERPDAAPELSLDRPVLFAQAVRVLRVDHAVHLLPESADDRALPAPTPATVLVYRDTDHVLRYLDLSPAAAAILEGLLRGEPLQTSILTGAARAAVPVDDALLHGTSVLLADLADRGVLLGGG